ncbi:MAG: hypothetical protein ABIR20_05415 [Lysobacter sp.]
MLAAFLLLFGLPLAFGGIQLGTLDGSWGYALLAAPLLVSAALLFLRKRSALLAYAVVILASLFWAIQEVGFDWWAMAPREGVVVVLGLLLLGGPIVTAGGVAFLSGTVDYYVRGYDLANGRELWRARLPAGGQSTPATYLGRDGRQYLVVVAGGHRYTGTKTGDSIIAYALPAK